MKYLTVLFLFLAGCTQTHQTAHPPTVADCKGEILPDSLVNTAGILPTLCFDTVKYIFFNAWIPNFDSKKDTTGMQHKGLYLFSDFQISHDQMVRQHIEIDNMYLTVFHDLGFEMISNLMVVWDKCDDHTLRLNTILDHSIVGSIGYAAFREIHRESYSTSMTDDGPDKSKSLQYSLNLAKMTAEITLLEETQNETGNLTIPLYTKRILLQEKP